MNALINTKVGIEALNVYCGVAQIPVTTMFEARNLDTDRLKNLMMVKRAISLPYEDPITNAVNAAKPIIDQLTDDERNSIEMVVTASESGIDYSKSIASYVHEYLGLSKNCRLLEVKQACYSSTAAVQMAAGYLASGISPGAKVLVIGTDVSLVNARAEYMEPTVGTGGAAVLLGNNPKIAQLDLGAFGNYSFEVLDSARPTPNFEVADVDGSLFTYLDCFSNSFQDYESKVENTDFCKTFPYLAMHTPFVGLVKAAHRKVMLEKTDYSAKQIGEDFTQRVSHSLHYPSMVGNLCSASVYLALASVIDHAPLDEPARIGLFSYGSGCASEFFSAIIDRESKQTLAKMEIGEYFESRCELSFDDYNNLLEENLKCLQAVENRKVETDKYDHYLNRVKKRRKMLVLDEVKNYHRKYKWI